ncbi:hypothetical protein M405DRAFT_228510 [Rhizopogon salebrosus TDB-379]|nr:hypothetical protein M405DRAFT_228510 [Rhizopogon salebrosus TDB-379]
MGLRSLIHFLRSTMKLTKALVIGIILYILVGIRLCKQLFFDTPYVSGARERLIFTCKTSFLSRHFKGPLKWH